MSSTRIVQINKMDQCSECQGSLSPKQWAVMDGGTLWCFDCWNELETPTPPDSQVARGLIEVIEDAANRLHRRFPTKKVIAILRGAITQAKSQLAEPDPKTLAATMSVMAKVKDTLKEQIQEFSSAGKYANDYCDEWARDLQALLDELEAIG